MDAQNETVSAQRDVWLPLAPAAVGMVEQQVKPVWLLVLSARGIPYRLAPDQSEMQLLVPEEHLHAAIYELQCYETENRNWPPPSTPTRELDQSVLATLSILILLAAFHNFVRADLIMINGVLPDWFSLGMVQAGSIRAGEWWRLITALTLHADLPHLLGNLAVGGLFVFLLCREWGTGLSWLLTLLAGLLGNLANVFLQPAAHNSVGASTAVFGVVGILAGVRVIRHRQHQQYRWSLPVAGAVALLVILGSEGKNTDLGAHLFGLVSGIPLGVSVELLISRFGPVPRLANLLLGLLSMVCVAGAWWLALS
ncbi:MAG: rhomboid family intramembrane serine protease [Trichlorobacter sp.]|uniref:rhomboid family intramembrane serine protease n=1 Tax=Trichlorobacter sp. TaxID=2911007 RepID=UPI002564B4AD|nr:rhomboid family intramembrane serine protease [Trichlorobacter sp.]MDK9716510.1 rhomboid family intramembrane serine protease [Trichlorobacter sp.]